MLNMKEALSQKRIRMARFQLGKNGDSSACSNSDLDHKIRRGHSLIDTVNAGVSDSPGARSTQEDVHRLILWTKALNSENGDMMNPNVGVFDHNSEPDIQTHSKKVKRSHSSISEHYGDENSISFFLVADGHGGKEAANFVNSHLCDNIIHQSNFKKDPESAIAEGFKETEASLSELAKEEEINGSVGTTVTVAIIVGNVLYVANIGDSEAVMCTGGKERVITTKHTLLNTEEKTRVEQEGGIIVSDHSNSRLGHPVWNPRYISLGITRAIGDFYFKDSEYVGEKRSGLIADPKITKFELTREDDFLLIASDGFWDVVSPKEAVEYVKKKIHLDSNTLCKNLVLLGEHRNSTDNITVLLIKFNIPASVI